MRRDSKGRFCPTRKRNPVKGDEHAKEILRLRRKHAAYMRSLLKKPKPHKKNLDAYWKGGKLHPIRKSKDYTSFLAKGG